MTSLCCVNPTTSYGVVCAFRSGVGISFSGLAGLEQGLLVAVAIGLHNIPEGLAVACAVPALPPSHVFPLESSDIQRAVVPLTYCTLLSAVVLVARGESATFATMWAVLSSLGQPLVAIPAFLFVEYFAAVQPLAFGFAAGSMIFVVLIELLPEAFQKSDPETAAVRRHSGGSTD